MSHKKFFLYLNMWTHVKDQGLQHWWNLLIQSSWLKVNQNFQLYFHESLLWILIRITFAWQFCIHVNKILRKYVPPCQVLWFLVIAVKPPCVCCSMRLVQPKIIPPVCYMQILHCDITCVRQAILNLSKGLRKLFNEWPTNSYNTYSLWTRGYFFIFNIYRTIAVHRSDT